MICVDASVAVKWILEDEQNDRADALYEATVRAGQPIVAPPLLPLEITNILRQRMRAQDGLPLARATEHLDAFLSLPITYQNPPGLHRRALALADIYGLPAAYDAHYLALAEQFACEFWTDDQRLLRRLGNSLPLVRRIGEYASA